MYVICKGVVSLSGCTALSSGVGEPYCITVVASMIPGVLASLGRTTGTHPERLHIKAGHITRSALKLNSRISCRARTKGTFLDS